MEEKMTGALFPLWDCPHSPLITEPPLTNLC